MEIQKLLIFWRSQAQIELSRSQAIVIIVMHPLEQSIDVDFHKPNQVRRRLSLDNSCLSATESFTALLQEDERQEFEKKERRLSWDASMESTNTTFLASIRTSPEQAKVTKVDLDADRHSSNHGSGHAAHERTHGKPSSHSKNSQPETIDSDSYSSSAEEESSESSFDDDSDCDSFCDASIGEKANKTYLRRDLGASVMWSDDDFSLADSWDGVSMDSPPGKPQRTLSGSLGRGKSLQFLRPPLRNNHSSEMSPLVTSLGASPKRRGRRNLVLDVEEEPPMQLLQLDE